MADVGRPGGGAEGGPKTREDAQMELSDLYRNTGVFVIMWNGGRDYNYSDVIAAVPKVGAAIRSVVDQDPALKNEYVIFELAGYRTGVVLDGNSRRNIAIDYTQPQEVIQRTIEDALRPLKLRKNVSKSLSELARRSDIKDIYLWPNREYDCESIDRALPKIEEAIKALPREVREALKEQEMVIQQDGGRIGLVLDAENNRKIAIDHKASQADISAVIEPASKQISTRSELAKKLSDMARRQRVKAVQFWVNSDEYSYAEIETRIDEIEEALRMLPPVMKTEIGPSSEVVIILQKDGGNYSSKDPNVIVIDPRASAEDIARVIEDALDRLNGEKRFQEKLVNLERKIGKPISRSDALARAGIFPDLSKIEAAFDDLLYHGVTFQNAGNFSIIGPTTAIRPGDKEINYEAEPADTVARVLRYLDSEAGDDRHNEQYFATKRNIDNNRELFEGGVGEMYTRFEVDTGVELTSDDDLLADPRSLHGLIANLKATLNLMVFDIGSFKINLVEKGSGVGYRELRGGVCVVNLPVDIPLEPLRDVLTGAVANFDRRRELNDRLGQIAGGNGFLSIVVYPDYFGGFAGYEIDPEKVRAMTDTSDYSPELKRAARSWPILVSPDDRWVDLGQVGLNCAMEVDEAKANLRRLVEANVGSARTLGRRDRDDELPLPPPSSTSRTDDSGSFGFGRPMGAPEDPDDARDRTRRRESDPKAEKKVELELRQLSRRTGVNVLKWERRRYDYDEVLSRLPTVSRAVRTLVGEDPALKEERVVLSLAGHETGVVQNRRGDRLIEIDYTQDEEVILQTMRDALNILKARKAVEAKLTDLAKSYNIKDIFLWNNLKYDYDKIDQLMPNIRTAIRRLPSDVFNKIGTGSGVRIVLKGRDEEVGLIQNRSVGKVIAIDAEASEDEIKKVIVEAAEKLPEVTNWRKAALVTGAVLKFPLDVLLLKPAQLGASQLHLALNRGINLASSAADSIRGMTGRGVRRVLLAGAVVGGGFAAYKTLPVVERNVDAVASAAADLFSGRSGSSDAPAPPEPVTSGAEAPRPVEGDSPVVPRVQSAPPAPEVTSDMRELMNTKMTMVEGVKLLNNGDIFGAKSKLLDAKRAAEKITDQAQKDLILEKINGFLSKAEPAE